jgi:hypothetical protein
MTNELSDVRQFTASPRYAFLAAGALLATVMLGYDLFQELRWDTALFFLIGLIGGLWSLWMATTRLYTTPDGLVVRRFTTSFLVQYRQIASAEASGRLLRVLTIVVHPREESGLVDPSAIYAVQVPSVSNQDELLEILEARIPG